MAVTDRHFRALVRLLTRRTVLAHSTFIDDDDMALIAAAEAEDEAPDEHDDVAGVARDAPLIVLMKTRHARAQAQNRQVAALVGTVSEDVWQEVFLFLEPHETMAPARAAKALNNAARRDGL